MLELGLGKLYGLSQTPDLAGFLGKKSYNLIRLIQRLFF
jgi:hypothetical protein